MNEIIPQELVLIQQAILYCGVDEAGAGPLCGDVVAAAVILDPENPIAGLNDSKKLTEKKREALFPEIKEKALAFCIARASVEEIDEINILHARMLAMTRAVNGLTMAPQHALIDGNRLPLNLCCDATPIVKGDALVAAIAAASVLAKVQRDHEMVKLDALYPQYGLAQHKGYPTKAHIAALNEHGPVDIYRKTFGPVKALL
ncbi:ribonuclease HII [Bermanella sp. 47_1433_sub80_T6]|nr:ribonuclease HII [Bermanella sp. 47_1433_sub80_T6]